VLYFIFSIISGLQQTGHTKMILNQLGKKFIAEAKTGSLTGKTQKMHSS